MLKRINMEAMSAPTVSRSSPRIILALAMIMGWEVAILDISSAFTQSHLMQPSERIILLMPWYIPAPWRGSLNLRKDDGARATHGLLTMRPLYGTACAPMRWFSCISE